MIATLVFFTVLALLALAGIAGTIVLVARDGYAARPTEHSRLPVELRRTNTAQRGGGYAVSTEAMCASGAKTADAAAARSESRSTSPGSAASATSCSAIA